MKKALAVLMAICLVWAVAVPVSANSAPINLRGGVDGIGSIVVDENNPLIVEHELLTFDIQNFPTKDSSIEDNATVTAQYTFYNPTDEPVTATLLFPYGAMPNYVDRYQEVYREDVADSIGYAVDDTKQYGVLVDGKAIPMTIRASLEPPYATEENPYGRFVLEIGLERLHDGVMEDEFFYPELPVTKYTYTIHDLGETSGWAYALFLTEPCVQEGKTCLYIEDGAPSAETYCGAQLHGFEKEIALYVFGEPLTEQPQWECYSHWDADPAKKISGTLELASTETMTFWEFALAGWQEDTGVIQTDWYNLVVEDVYWWSWGKLKTVICPVGYENNYTQWIMRWYEYEITVAPKSRVVNTVTAPIYPDIDPRYKPELYDYIYLLSPAQKWQSFGTLEVVVNTPYYMIECNQGEFTKTENGYTMTFDGLPEGELEFRLSEKKWQIPVLNPGQILLGVLIFGLPTIAIGMVVYIVVGFIKKPKRKEKTG